MTIHEVSKLSGVSVRTLHHYDAIFLLSPRRNKENGYRDYDDGDLDRLQQILLFKACGFSLVKIKELLARSDFDREKAYSLQRKYLLHEQNRINTMLETLEKSIKHLKGDIIMSQQDKFTGFDLTNNPYEAEARQLWGDEAVEKSNAQMASLSAEAQGSLLNKMDALFSGLATLVHKAPDADEVQAAMDNMYQFFNANFGYHYSLEAFAGLGERYVADPRFTENIDRYAHGLSAFLCQAMKRYAEDHA